MAAMDVVDVLRHQQDLVARELDTETREKELLERLRKIYKSQGIDVPDSVLKEGIKALDEDRFKYTPHEKNFGTTLADLYVRRDKWGKPLGVIVLIGALVFGWNYFTNIRPAQQKRDAIPSNITKTFSEFKKIAKNPELVTQAEQIKQSANAAYKNGKYDVAQNLLGELDNQVVTLRQNFKIRVISRPNENSGIWRIAEVNSTNRNYYLVVEAINQSNKALRLPILNEENGKRDFVDKWALRVDQDTFYRVANDKKDDGIIQNNIVGEKLRGYLKPNYSVNTTGASITQW